MLTVSKNQSVYKMSGKNDPAAVCRSGETIVFETEDCFGGQIRSENQCMNGICWDNINPASGPLFIEDAEPGDILKVEILKIELASQGVICDSPGEGVTGKVLTGEATKIIPVADGVAVFNDLLRFSVKPMIGVIGTAPADGVEIETGTPGEHGGNMDCREIGENCTLYLPVHVPGALLAMGDVHAIMGDGEVCVCGVEIPAVITVKVTVVKEQKLPVPFLVTPENFMTIYSAGNLDDAVEGAVLRMRSFLINELGMEEHEAGFLLSAVGNARICQCVDPQETCRMEVSRYVAERYGYVFF